MHAAYDHVNDGERLEIDMVLIAVVYVYNPLSIAAISALMQMPIENTEAALSSLHSLTYIPSKPDMPILIFHASMISFLIKGFLQSTILTPAFHINL